MQGKLERNPKILRTLKCLTFLTKLITVKICSYGALLNHSLQGSQLCKLLISVLFMSDKVKDNLHMIFFGRSAGKLSQE